MNMAATWKLPIIYCLINNQYAISTHYTESHPQKQLATWGDGYGVPNETVDGNDVEAVYEAVQRAAERARAGGGPTLLELMTYRWQGHFSGDPAAYRPDEELAALEKTADAEIAECVRFSLESPWPDLTSALTHVYADLEVEGWK
jgi:pyruvate dehydrogenase E1 component alpha subunit